MCHKYSDSTHCNAYGYCYSIYHGHCYRMYHGHFYSMYLWFLVAQRAAAAAPAAGLAAAPGSLAPSLLQLRHRLHLDRPGLHLPLDHRQQLGREALEVAAAAKVELGKEVLGVPLAPAGDMLERIGYLQDYLRN
jgi:hypothetical protein